ncbi:hypothetical protein T09_10899 [Trichinella sp. T9]|nr:hypothetical protein T09_10899 [Trichinella sp. T9]
MVRINRTSDSVTLGFKPVVTSETTSHSSLILVDYNPTYETTAVIQKLE